MTAGKLGLPNAKTGQIVELLEKLEFLGGVSDREGLAIALDIKPHTVYNPLKAAEILGFVSIDDNKVEFTEVGWDFLNGNTDKRKATFREQMIKVEPFTIISKALEKELSCDVVLRLIKAKIKAARKWKPGADKEMLRMIINWGTYSELFKFDRESRKLLPKK
jgi:hypothetical protein